MGNSVSYMNCLIRGESFQLPQSDSWIPRYTLMREGDESESAESLIHHDRLDKVFWTKHEADEFALEDAKQWIDKN
jgi:hypothetical protein